MPNEFSRTERVNELVKRQLAKLIQKEVKDPRISKFVTVSAVSVSNDLSHARIYISMFSEDETDIQKTMQGLEKAKGFLRKKLGQEIKLRITPELHFHYDNSVVEGNRLSKIIDDAVSQESNNPLDDDNEQ